MSDVDEIDLKRGSPRLLCVLGLCHFDSRVISPPETSHFSGVGGYRGIPRVQHAVVNMRIGANECQSASRIQAIFRRITRAETDFSDLRPPPYIEQQSNFLSCFAMLGFSMHAQPPTNPPRDMGLDNTYIYANGEM